MLGDGEARETLRLLGSVFGVFSSLCSLICVWSLLVGAFFCVDAPARPSKRFTRPCLIEGDERFDELVHLSVVPRDDDRLIRLQLVLKSN